MLGEAMREAGVDGAPEVVEVNSFEDAKLVRSFGSPTIRVEGIEIEYWEREPEEFTSGCRYYSSPEGWKPLPHKGLIVGALERVKAQAGR